MENQYTRLEYLFQKDLEKIKNSKVCVVGLGGVGGIALEALVRSGVSEITICDFDNVNVSNINRQVIANYNTIGMKKVDASIALIKSINPNAIIHAYDKKIDENNLEFFNNGFDYLIDAIDDINAKILIIKECLKRNITFISSMGTAKKLDPTRFKVVDIKKTNYDPIAKILRKRFREEEIIGKIMVVYSDEEPLAIDKLGSYMPVVSSAGLLSSDYIIKEILRRE